MKNHPDESTCIFGACAILKHVQGIRHEIEGVRLGEDIEAIHDMRVASRRLRACLSLFEPCLPKKKLQDWTLQVRKITKALGAARDDDVQIEKLEQTLGQLPKPIYRTGILRLILRKRQERQMLQAKVLKALDKLEESHVLDQIEATESPLTAKEGEVYLYTPGLYQLSFNAIHAELEDFLSYESVVYQPEKVKELHEMRIAAKRLRYTMETLAPLYPEELKDPIKAIKKAQTTLGDIHDDDVWIMTLPQFIEEERKMALDYYGNTRPVTRLLPGLAYFLQERQDARQKEYQSFVEDWMDWQAEGIWSSLASTIRLPFVRADRAQPSAPGPETGEQGTAI